MRHHHPADHPEAFNLTVALLLIVGDPARSPAQCHDDSAALLAGHDHATIATALHKQAHLMAQMMGDNLAHMRPWLQSTLAEHAAANGN